MPLDNLLIMQKYNELLLQLQERLTTVEKRVSALENPQLMYKPPQSQSYKTIAETLDDLHNAVEELRDAQRSEEG